MWGAIFGDIVIVLGVAAVSLLFVGTRAFLPPTLPPTGCGWLALFGVGFVAGVGLEWAARALHLWGYNAWMPTVRIATYEVGLVPIAQVTLLPALSV